MTQSLPDPVIFTEFPLNVGIKLFAPGDIRPTPQQRAAYLRFTKRGDPLADGVVAMFRRLPTGEGRRMFEAAVEHGIDSVPDAPQELVDFFAQVDAIPYWLDHHKLDIAARATGRTGFWGMNLALPALALMGGYLASRADKTLVGTGDLDYMAPRRLTETAGWWVDVTTLGALGRFERGFKGILRVRLMHALVRAGMKRRDDWDYDEWDEPVNQSLTAGTLILFSMANVLGCQTLGLHFSAREKDAIYHFWRYVGYLMGVDAELLPATEEDTWRLFWLQADYEFRPDADSQRLAQALIRAIGPVYSFDETTRAGRATVWALTRYITAYSRILLGDSNADFLGLPKSRAFQAAVLATAAGNTLLELPRRAIPGATRMHEALGHRVRRTMNNHSMALLQGDRTFQRHDRLVRSA